MTIVVFRDGVMAADSGAWAGDASYAPVRKVGCAASGNLYGCAGSAGAVSKFLAWVDGGEIGDMPLPVSLGGGDNNFIALIWRPQSGLSLLGGDGEEDWIDRRVMNKVGLYVDGQAVYPTFSDAEHVSKDALEPVEGWPIIVGLDFGREPAAAFGQNINGHIVVISELIGENESAELFAPKVRRHLSQRYPGFSYEFSGDPRGADGSQNSEITAYEIFQKHGMRVFPATSDNNPQMRRSAMEGVLGRRNGFLVCTSCLVAKTGLAGGYHYPKIKVRGVTGLFSDKPRKNRYSHIVEAIENLILGAGEGEAVVRSSREKPKPSPVRRHRIQMRSAR